MARMFDHISPVEGKGLHDVLAAADRLRATLPEQLQHRVALADPGLFDDEIIARTRGLLLHLTEQIAGSKPVEHNAGVRDSDVRYNIRRDAILRDVFANEALLSYTHAATLEYVLTCRLSDEADLDPALSPLLQDLAGRPDQTLSQLATSAISLQSRFLTDMRRMQMPLRQLPGDLLHTALAIGRAHSDNTLLADAIDQAVQVSYDEAATRLGLLGLIVNVPGFPALRGLRLEDAGTPLFLSSLSAASSLGYEDAVMLTTRQQILRLALVLRGTGCSPRAVNHDLFLLHEQVAAPAIARMPRERALELLSQTGRMSGNSAA